MSAAAAWSYTAKATLWPLLSRHAGTRAPTYGAPVQIDCDYSSESTTMVDQAGDPLAVQQVIYTERADIKHGDMLLIGVSALADPVAAGARRVGAIGRDADTFDRKADDYKVGTI
jgi:hypothetical protein